MSGRTNPLPWSRCGRWTFGCNAPAHRVAGAADGFQQSLQCLAAAPWGCSAGQQRRASKKVVAGQGPTMNEHDALTQCQGEGPFVMASNPTGHDRLQRSANRGLLPSRTTPQMRPRTTPLFQMTASRYLQPLGRQRRANSGCSAARARLRPKEQRAEKLERAYDPQSNRRRRSRGRRGCPHTYCT